METHKKLLQSLKIRMKSDKKSFFDKKEISYQSIVQGLKTYGLKIFSDTLYKNHLY